MPRFVDTVAANPTCRVFRVPRPHPDDPREWVLDPLKAGILLGDGQDDLYVVAALNILPDRRVIDCYLDISLPERINDFAYFIRGGDLHRGYAHEFPGEFIPAIAIDCFGVYELFYSKTAPEIGIDVLRRGLAIAERKQYIAQDLAYILRDEGRYREAAEMFELALTNDLYSYMTCLEIASAYGKSGDTERERHYRTMAKDRAPGSRRKPK